MSTLPKAFSAEDLDELLSDAGRREMAKPAVLAGDDAAEMSASEPRWYVVETFPQCEREVIDELTKRRFGLYVPEVEETIVRRGRKIERKVLMFTRYLFVFMWLTDRNYQLVRCTKGVLNFASSDGVRPIAISWREIDLLRAIENSFRPFPLVLMDPVDEEPPPHLSKKGRRRWKKQRQKPRYVDPIDDIVNVRSWSAFDDVDLPSLDSEARNQTLANALGLAPSTCPRNGDRADRR